MANEPDDPAKRRPRGLLITGDPDLARAFQCALKRCDGSSIAFELQTNLDEARRSGGARYQSVTIDLDGSIVPDQAVRIAREAWPEARIAVLCHWWSERETTTREQADVVIHKPLRTAELQAFLRSPTGAPDAGARDADAPGGREDGAVSQEVGAAKVR